MKLKLLSILYGFPLNQKSIHLLAVIPLESVPSPEVSKPFFRISKTFLAVFQSHEFQLSFIPEVALGLLGYIHLAVSAIGSKTLTYSLDS